MRASVLAAILLLPVTGARAWGADLFVRPDGNDANPGTENSAAGALRTVGRCAALAGPGDRCRIQPGTYLETAIVQASGGSLVGEGLASCGCTRGSTRIRCAGPLPAQVAPGTFVRCAGAPGFAWSKVAAVDGADLTLAEPYRGASLADAPLGAARFVELRGEGAGPREVRISEFRPPPPPVVWEKVAGAACLWRYPKANAVDPTWKYPTGFREDVPDASWDLFVEDKNGRDLYDRLWGAGAAPDDSLGDCPCQAATVAEGVAGSPGSWGDDGTFVYLRTRACADPVDARVVAGRHGSGGELGATFRAQQPFTVVENLSVEVGGFDTAAVPGRAHGLVLGASNARYSRLHQEGGRVLFAAPPGSEATRFEAVRALSGAACELSGGHGGLSLYEVEIRGGGLSCSALRGAGEEDRILVERLYLHRSFARRAGVAACGELSWDCASGGFAPCAACEGGDPRARAGPGASFGRAEDDNATDHLLVRNSVVELVGDGLALFGGQGGADVWLVNNTFGASHRLDGAVEVRLGSQAAAGAWGAHLRNNLFLLGAAHGAVRWEGARGDLRSDHNLFLAAGLSGEVRIWNAAETLEQVIAGSGQETHSVVVCASGCAGGAGIYFNDGSATGLTDPSLLDGSPSDYRPTAAFRGLDRGDPSACPEEDFLGQPRAAGACDLGALEYREAPAPADAGLAPDASAAADAAGPGPDAAPSGEDAASEPAPDAAASADAGGEGKDAGLADAGGLAPDAAVPVVDASGCGCGAGGGEGLGWLLALVAAFALGRRSGRLFDLEGPCR